MNPKLYSVTTTLENPNDGTDFEAVIWVNEAETPSEGYTGVLHVDFKVKNRETEMLVRREIQEIITELGYLIGEIVDRVDINIKQKLEKKSMVGYYK